MSFFPTKSSIDLRGCCRLPEILLQWIIFFVLGACVTLILSNILMKHEVNHPSPAPSSKFLAWSGSDYLSNSDYYKRLTDIHDFTQMDYLRLDILSSPRFHPTNGKSVIC